MPLSRSKTYQDVALLVFNVDTGLERARHRHSEAKRKHPLVFKESGEKRLYAFDQKLLQVLPSNEWTILVYKIQVESQGTSATPSNENYYFMPYICSIHATTTMMIHEMMLL